MTVMQRKGGVVRIPNCLAQILARWRTLSKHLPTARSDIFFKQKLHENCISTDIPIKAVPRDEDSPAARASTWLTSPCPKESESLCIALYSNRFLRSAEDYMIHSSFKPRKGSVRLSGFGKLMYGIVSNVVA